MAFRPKHLSNHDRKFALVLCRAYFSTTTCSAFSLLILLIICIRLEPMMFNMLRIDCETTDNVHCIACLVQEFRMVDRRCSSLIGPSCFRCFNLGFSSVLSPVSLVVRHVCPASAPSREPLWCAPLDVFA